MIHTGPESKLIQNLGIYSTKYSTLDNNINFIFVLVLSFLAFLCTFGAIANLFFTQKMRTQHLYAFEEGPTPNLWTVIARLLSMFLVLHVMIPLQLIIVMDATKLFSARKITSDAWMMYPQIETKSIAHAEARSLNL